MWEMMAGLLVGTAVSGILPLVNAELLVAAAAVAAPEIGVPLLAGVAATGQMSTKTLLYGVARWAPSRLGHKARSALDKASRAVASRGGAAGSMVFASAAVGIPPFFGVSLAAGALGMRLRSFLMSGGAGRLVRFAAVAWAARHVGAGMLDAIAAIVPLGAAVGG